MKHKKLLSWLLSGAIVATMIPASALFAASAEEAPQNIALKATATASSEMSRAPAKGAIDGVIGGYPNNRANEWETDHGKGGTWIRLMFDNTYKVSSVKLYDRLNAADQITSGTLYFSDGSEVTFGELPNDGYTPLEIKFEEREVEWVKLVVDSVLNDDDTTSTGLAEFEVYGIPVSNKTNIARNAIAFASSEVDTGPAGGAINGVVGGYPGNRADEWASDHGVAGSWIMLLFDQNYLVDSIRLYDRPNTNDQVASGTLVFSDGSRVAVGALPNDAKDPLIVKFDEKEVSWVKFYIDSVSKNTTNIGLAEFEVFGSPIGEKPEGTDIGLLSKVKYNGAWWDMPAVLEFGQLLGDEMQLFWNGKQRVDTINLYDLPSETDHVLSGRLVFDDGSEIAVGELPNDGSALKVDIGGRKTEFIKFVIDSVSETTENVGIAKINVFGEIINEREAISYRDVQVTERWKGGSLFEKDGKLCYAKAGETPADAFYWDMIPDSNGLYTIQNKATGNYVTAVDGADYIASQPEKTAKSLWRISPTSGYQRIINAENDQIVLNVESQTEIMEPTYAPEHYFSAHWSFTDKDSFAPYTISSDKIVDGSNVATAYTGDMIKANSYGNSRTWFLSKDISGLPQFSAPNMPMGEAIYNMALEESLKNVNLTSDGKEVFYTGANWSKVWNRDTAISVQYSLAWAFPQISKNSMLEKIIGDPKELVEDTGTGGSYPTSTDRIIMAISIWEYYLATGDTEYLSDMYDIMAYTAEKDFHVNYSGKLGLFKGETSGLDHRSKTYPDYFDEQNFSDIAASFATSTNVEYAAMFEILATSAEILGKDAAEAKYWTECHNTLVNKINEKMWLEDRGYYTSFLYPDYMGAPMADKTDVLACGYALMYNIAPEDRAQSIMENYPMVKYGANTVYPQKQGKQFGAIYHNRGVWPGWEGTLMIGAKRQGNNQLAEEIMRSCMIGAAMNLTNNEVIHYQTGKASAGDRQLWSVAAQLAGYYRVLFGMDYTVDGITFAPFVPEWMDGPFELTDLKYHDTTLNLKLSGKGDTLVSIIVDGEEKDLSYIFPTDLTGEHTVEMVVSDSGERDSINLKEENLVICPELPTMQLNGDTLTWNEDSRYTYKIWDGAKYIPVSGGSYQIPMDHYATYSLVAIDEMGVCSELSKPIIVNPDTPLTYELEDAEYEAKNFANKESGFTGSGYIVSDMGNNTDIKVEVEIPQGKAGSYLLSMIYTNTKNGDDGNCSAIRSIYLDGKDYGSLYFSASRGKWQESPHLDMYLTEGKHTIEITYNRDDEYDINMHRTINDVLLDSLTLERRGEMLRVSEGRIDENILSGVMGNITAGELKDIIQVDASSLRVVDNTGASVADDANVATGYRVQLLQNGMIVQDVTIAVGGDVGGTGRLGVQDLLSIKSYILGRADYSKLQKLSADVNADGIVNIFDLVAVKFAILRG
ncbi:DUF7402 domain-containing protein [Candidatus Soleaferrea massiliensis]|uniref:DUF7402 domain-containing protein n=1 Tax=Candidatus Soleaferrea massiliensis TaxID=1470354 RepID=UPI0018CE17A8|nr:discoidin domain-containing protein [Candidatus Soleaferrea massiliensis]